MNAIEDVLLFQLDQTVRQSKIYSQRELDAREAGITVDQWVLLKIIHEHPDISQKELAERALRDPASITRSLDLLETKGFIERHTIENNRRQHRLTLSNQGKKFVNDLLPMVKTHRENSIKGLTSSQIETAQAVLQKMRENMT